MQDMSAAILGADAFVQTGPWHRYIEFYPIQSLHLIFMASNNWQGKLSVIHQHDKSYFKEQKSSLGNIYLRCPSSFLAKVLPGETEQQKFMIYSGALH